MIPNMPQELYIPLFNVWARPITVTPLVSQPGAPSYDARGYYSTNPVDILTENGRVLSDAESILDILQVEFPVLPLQGDQIDIPPHQDLEGGSFYVHDSDNNAMGLYWLTLRSRV